MRVQAVLLPILRQNVLALRKFGFELLLGDECQCIDVGELVGGLVFSLPVDVAPRLVIDKSILQVLDVECDVQSLHLLRMTCPVQNLLQVDLDTLHLELLDFNLDVVVLDHDIVA